MKKKVAFLPAPMPTLSLSAAESVPMNREERMKCPAKFFSDEDECFYERCLIGEPLRFTEEYGGLTAVMAGGEEYQAFEDCRAAVSVQ